MSGDGKVVDLSAYRQAARLDPATNDPVADDPATDDPATATHGNGAPVPDVPPARATSRRGPGPAPYAELHCLSNFSFHRGASSAEELFERAKKLGYRALAITDEASFAGIVHAFEAARDTGLKLITGTEMTLADGTKLVLLAQTQAGYTRLCQWITLARRRAKKGAYVLFREDLDDTAGVLVQWIPDPAMANPAADTATAHWLATAFPARAWIAVQLHRGPDDAIRLAYLEALGERAGLPRVATGDVHMHVRKRRALQDTLTAIRLGTRIADAGQHLFPNGERHLRTRQALDAIHPRALLEESARIADLCSFTLDQLRYQYPHELVPEGKTATQWLRELTATGSTWRWPQGASEEAAAAIDEELQIIADLKYESYFLTVHDIVRFARGSGILCQGRGSAANSVVCYVLGVTEIDPTRMGMLFERFLSRERNEPPDIDIDFEHERREEVLQYVFRRYGRERAALTAVAIRYRGRSAIRDVAKALGLATDQVDELARAMGHWSSENPGESSLRERGFDPTAPVMQRLLGLTAQLVGFPRHLSQHPGGFVISEHPLNTLVPVENAAMPDRTIIQWDKDDLDVLGLLKVDCLALGMLTAVRKTFQLLRDSGRRDLTMQSIPADCRDTYAMIGKADTIGVFQIESRAQMAMLPRMQPTCFYDLVIEVAIVRPGPIQGDMVHPYLQRRKDPSLITYPREELRPVFERTLGVPLFQEQVMQLAIVAAGYSADEADVLRRSMAAWKRKGGLDPHRERLLQGMLERGYTEAYAGKLFDQIKGFGSYGFPESHAASFALITYVSCWLKCHEPAAFACALLNAYPLGFYTPDQVLQDARRHALQVLPVDVRHSHWDNRLVPRDDVPGHAQGLPPAAGEFRADATQPAIRLGLRMVHGLRQDMGERIMVAASLQPFRDVDDLCGRAGIDRRAQSLLADAGALKGLAGHRHRARWAVGGVEPQLPLFAGVAPLPEAQIALPAPTVAEDVHADYRSVGHTLGPHPLSLLRRTLSQRRCRRSAELRAMPDGRPVRFAGLVTLRQRPQTASGVMFMTLEDEDGMVNVVVWNQIVETQRRVLLESRLLVVEGRLQCQDGVQHLVARRLENLTPLLGDLDTGSRDFR